MEYIAAAIVFAAIAWQMKGVKPPKRLAEVFAVGVLMGALILAYVKALF